MATIEVVCLSCGHPDYADALAVRPRGEWSCPTCGFFAATDRAVAEHRRTGVPRP